ncbi:hypothetical protein ABMA70_02915 [Halobacteriovorax sp. XZX-3]|uniref:hypothetical protein n=1 Tax=unclassified Halobacteriovorax TaxID=2639665 RepID=UPI0011AF538F|nr:hypothetical protein [Halobacteriovorax sp. DA5]
MNSKMQHTFKDDEIDLAKEIILENISFFEWMNMENLLISIKSEDLSLLDDVNMEVLEAYLNEFIREGLVEVKHEAKNEAFYRRVQIKKKKFLKFF